MENLQPKLRFPEFKDRWKESNIKENTNQLNGFAFKGNDISTEPYGLRLIRGINITEGYIRNNKEIDRYFNGDISKLEKYKVQIEDLVIGMDGSKVGKNIALITEKNLNELLVQRVSRLRKKNSNINFIYQLINNYRFHSYVDKVNTSSGIPHISSKQIDEYKIFIPTLQEQTKIADFLGAVDKQLDILNQKKGKLNTYKKGVMQQLFAQQLRFKDDNGNNYPDWQEKTLGEISKIFSGKSKKSEIDEGFNLYGSTGIIGLTDEPNHNGKSILVARVGANAGFLYKVDGKYGVSDNTLIITDLKDNFDFVYYLLIISNLNKFIFGSGQPLITGSILKKLTVSIPSLEEQTKIAEFLSAIDKQIEAVENQITKTETYKKGLLQQMFV